MTMAAVLVVGSGLLARSLLGLLAVDVGFTPDRVLNGRVSLAGQQFSSDDNARNIAATVQFYDALFGGSGSFPASRPRPA